MSKIVKKKTIILLTCISIGLIIRLAYCIVNPVQPRDSYKYIEIVTNWEETGIIEKEIDFYPLSLWIMKIPRQLFHCDIGLGGILVNIEIGLLLIAILMQETDKLFRKNYVTLIVGLLAASHPMLVRLSCSFLRDNSYLLFFVLFAKEINNYLRNKKSRTFFGIGVLGALSFLCRLEGIEILAIALIIEVFLIIFKEISVSKGIKNILILAISFTITVFAVYYIIPCKTKAPFVLLTKHLTL